MSKSRIKRWTLKNGAELRITERSCDYGIAQGLMNPMSVFVEDFKLKIATEVALQIQEAHSFGESMDAGFDGGEFSGPAHSRME